MALRGHIERIGKRAGRTLPLASQNIED